MDDNHAARVKRHLRDLKREATFRGHRVLAAEAATRDLGQEAAA